MSVNLSNDTAMAVQTGATYQWLDCGNGNTEIASETNQMFIPAQSGSYSVIVDNGTCSDTSACQAIFVSGIYPAGNNENVSVNIYPNPTTGLFYVVGTGIKGIKVYNALGEVVYNVDCTNEKTVIDITNKAPGLYLIQVTTTTGTSLQKIVKK